jgi:hypothetical protein
VPRPLAADSDLIPAGIPIDPRPPAGGLRSLIVGRSLRLDLSQGEHMPTRRQKMRDVREVLRLHWEGCVPV